MTTNERAGETVKQLSYRTEISLEVANWLHDEIETQIRGAMKEQRQVCSEAIFAADMSDVRVRLSQAVLTAEVKP